MADDTIPAIAFDNQLAYDVVVYDSFDYNDDEDDSDNNTNGQSNSQAYFATLTQLGKIPAGTTVNIQPIHDSSAFVVESVTDNKPIKRLVALSFEEVTSLSIVKDDEAAMTQTFQFVSFFLNNPNDAVSAAFNKVLNNNTTEDLATDIDNFFGAQPAYNKCCFEDYMMAIAYTALHPSTPDPSQPAGSSSLKIISTLMGSKWPAYLSDIFVTKFTCTTKDKHLILTFEVDISALPFETAQIASNVLTLLNGTKVVKAQILFNYAIGLNIFGTRLSILLDALAIPIDNNKTLSIKKPEISIDINPLFKFVVFTMKATFPFNINGKNFDALASFAIDNEEVAIGVDIQGDHSSLPAPSGIKGLHFDEFGVGMGLFFEPPGFALGILGKFHIGDSSNTVINVDDNTFALVYEFVEEAVEPKYVAFSVPQLNLSQVIELFTNANPKIDVPISFSDLSFHWSDGLMDAVVLPDGTLSDGGYGFSASVKVFSFDFYGEMNLDLNSGLTANVEVSPVTLGSVFKLSGDGKGYSMKVDANGNPIKNNFVATTQVEKDALTKATSKQIVSPGGPCLIINTLSTPILHLNAKASFFDLINYAVTADVNKDGIKFELDYGAILTSKMVCNISDFHNLYGEFGYYIDKTIPLPAIGNEHLGSIPLKADVSLHLAIKTSTANVVISTGGQFDFEGYHFSFGDFNANINISKISDFVRAIVQYIIDNSKAVFSQLLDTAEHWAAAAGKGIITGYDAAEKVMKYSFNKTEQEMTTILKGAGFAANDIANGLKNGYNAASQDVAAVMKQAGYDVNTIGNTIKNTWNCGIDDVSWALHEAGYGAEDTANALKAAFNASVQDVANTFKKWGYAADDVARVIKNFFNGDSVAVANIMKQAGYAIDDISRGIKDAWNCTTNDVTYALKAVGFTADQVAVSLKNVFNAASQDVASALKAMNFTANEVAAAIKNCWNCAVSDVSWAMNEAGWAATDIGSGLKRAFNTPAQDIANSFKQVGITAQNTANAIKAVYNLPINDTASVLKQAGYAANDVASALQNAFNTSVNAVADAMKQVGYAANDVKDAFNQLGGDFKSFADNAWSDVKNVFNPSHW